MKTIVYVDLSNIVISLKSKNLKIDFDKFNIYLKDKFRPFKIIYFAPSLKTYNFLYTYDQDILLESVFKKVYSENSKLKANCDVDIAHRVTKDLDFGVTDSLVIVSGDGDFYPIFEYAKSLNKSIRVIAPTSESCSLLIKRDNQLKYFLLTDLGDLVFRNEKPPIET